MATEIFTIELKFRSLLIAKHLLEEKVNSRTGIDRSVKPMNDSYVNKSLFGSTNVIDKTALAITELSVLPMKLRLHYYQTE